MLARELSRLDTQHAADRGGCHAQQGGVGNDSPFHDARNLNHTATRQVLSLLALLVQKYKY
jgi:hypothetical protein